MTRIETTTGSDQPAPARDAAFQSTDVFAAVGEAPYEWRIDTDALAWGDNAAEVLKVADLRLIASGRAFAKLLDGDNVHTRFDAITRTSAADKGAGVPYQVQYGLRPKPGTDAKLWIEDVGRWFAGPDGKPRARARRRARHQRAPRPGGAARVPLALRRADRRAQPLASHRRALRHPRGGDPPARLVRVPHRRDRQSRPRQRGLRLRRRRRGDLRGGQAAARKDARRRFGSAATPATSSASSSRPARPTTSRPRPSACSPACATTWCRRRPDRSPSR